MNGNKNNNNNNNLFENSATTVQEFLLSLNNSNLNLNEINIQNNNEISSQSSQNSQNISKKRRKRKKDDNEVAREDWNEPLHNGVPIKQHFIKHLKGLLREEQNAFPARVHYISNYRKV